VVGVVVAVVVPVVVGVVVAVVVVVEVTVDVTLVVGVVVGVVAVSVVVTDVVTVVVGVTVGVVVVVVVGDEVAVVVGVVRKQPSNVPSANARTALFRTSTVCAQVCDVCAELLYPTSPPPMHWREPATVPLLNDSMARLSTAAVSSQLLPSSGLTGTSASALTVMPDTELHCRRPVGLAASLHASYRRLSSTSCTAQSSGCPSASSGWGTDATF